ncbi:MULTISPECIES: FKBP-type peptidyl-prolyl cis-trans isomerase [unclassified Acinetobacter]|uniref:FKBP-type peptidyl-prolyl cis-trans isomerase n=1 Tax=unclassified Acinetobacter TaxID=196816 RepID=UPI0035B873FD
MLKKIILSTALLTTISYANAAPITENSPESQKLGYTIGYRISETTKNTFANLDTQAFLQGVQAAIKGENPTITRESMNQVIDNYARQRQQQAMQPFTDFRNVVAGNAQVQAKFLANNAKRANVVTTKSGLQYEVFTQGTGVKPTANSNVLVNYEGRLLDGTVFDSSIARDHPVNFKVNQVIQGWQEALQLMPKGSVYRVFVPAELAYGEIGAGEIPPNSMLIFDIMLLDVDAK